MKFQNFSPRSLFRRTHCRVPLLPTRKLSLRGIEAIDNSFWELKDIATRWHYPRLLSNLVMYHMWSTSIPCWYFNCKCLSWPTKFKTRGLEFPKHIYEGYHFSSDTVQYQSFSHFISWQNPYSIEPCNSFMTRHI